MKKSKKHVPNNQVYEGRSLINLLHDFYHNYDGERLIALPSLNDNSPGLFDIYKQILEDEDDDDPDDPDMLELSQIEMGGKIRILTDVLNHPDWTVIRDFAQYSDIEIRHLENLNMYLFVHLGQKNAFSITGPMRFDEKFIDYNQEVIGFESASGYETCRRFFETIWEEAEPITYEKVERMIELANHEDDDCFDKELLEHTYFLFLPGKENDDDLYGIRGDNSINRSAFSGEITYKDSYGISFAYFVGIKIPKDAEQVIICGVNTDKNRIEYSQAFRVSGETPIREIDDNLYCYYPGQGFSIIQCWIGTSSTVDTYPRPKRYYSKNIYMAMEIHGFSFKDKDTINSNFKKKLNTKFRQDTAFRNALKETCFVKWSEVC